MEKSDNGTELVIDQESNTQPDEGVAVESEEKADSLQSADTNEFEIEIDNEGEPEQTPETQPDYEKARKAFREREAKRKAREAEENERKELIDRINKLESEKLNSNKPTLEGCDYDEEKFDKALSDYYQSLQSKPKQSSESEAKQAQEANPEIEIKAAKQEDEIRKKVSTYDNIKVDLAMKFANDGADPDAVIANIQSICHYADIDTAKAIIGLSKIPGNYDKLREVASNPVAVSSLLRKAADQVKIAQAKKVDSVPEPEINSSGAIDNTAAGVEKLRKQWLENSTSANYRKYQQAKAKLKGN